jgi:DNA-binding CsgD family transcriptional regulator
MATAAASARGRERVAEICGSEADARALRLRLLDELRREVGFQAYAWLLTDPQTSVGSQPLADVPCLPELPRLIELKYRTEINRWTSLGGQPVARLHEAAGGDLSRSLLWRELLSRYGIVDVASVVFRDQFGCWGFLDLWRDATAAPFGPDEAAFLADIAPTVTAALRRSQAAAFTPVGGDSGDGDSGAGGSGGASGGGDQQWGGPVVLLLSPRLEVLRQTPETQEYLRVLVPPEGGQPAIPASAYNVAAQLLANEAGTDQNPPWARVHLTGGQWVTLRAARIGGSGPADGSDIAVTIERTPGPERAGLFARACGLSARESELLGHLITGADTRELAQRMFLSGHTVQDHLKSIFAKTGIRTRRTLVSRALGS